jgi:hypothetical protein
LRAWISLKKTVSLDRNAATTLVPYIRRHFHSPTLVLLPETRRWPGSALRPWADRFPPLNQTADVYAYKLSSCVSQ